MVIIETIHLTEEQKQKLRLLWNEEYPEQLKHADLDSFSNYLNKVTPKKHYILKNQEEEIMGWVFLFERENESWFAMILSSRIHGKGIGTRLLRMIRKGKRNLPAG